MNCNWIFLKRPWNAFKVQHQQVRKTCWKSCCFFSIRGDTLSTRKNVVSSCGKTVHKQQCHPLPAVFKALFLSFKAINSLMSTFRFLLPVFRAYSSLILLNQRRRKCCPYYLIFKGCSCLKFKIPFKWADSSLTPKYNKLSRKHFQLFVRIL